MAAPAQRKAVNTRTGKSEQGQDCRIFIYTEQRTAQPASDSQPDQAAQSSVMGLVTDVMRAAALKYAHTGVVCLAAAFDTNLMEIPSVHSLCRG